MWFYDKIFEFASLSYINTSTTFLNQLFRNTKSSSRPEVFLKTSQNSQENTTTGNLP